MAYYYPWADGTRIPYNVVENVFLSASQNEQIERVLTYDIATPYAGAAGPIYGLRPELSPYSAPGTRTSTHTKR